MMQEINIMKNMHNNNINLNIIGVLLIKMVEHYLMQVSIYMHDGLQNKYFVKNVNIRITQ